MGKKSEERERRKALRQQKFDESKATFIAKVSGNHSPRVLHAPEKDEVPRISPHLARAIGTTDKTPKVVKDGSRYSYRVTWCTSKADQEDYWSWNEPRAWLQTEWDTDIHPAFTQFVQLTWGEIDQCSSESGHKMHHGHEVGDLVKEAQDRWKALDLEQFDSVFRFRLGGTKRAWGYIVQAHFHMVWWERYHSIYPVDKD